MNELIEMLRAKEKVESDLADVREAIVTYLVEKKMTPYFSVDWTKLWRHYIKETNSG